MSKETQSIDEYTTIDGPKLQEKSIQEESIQEELIKEMKNVFKTKIQQDYISKYLNVFPPSKSYEKIKDLMNPNTTRNLLELYDVDETKIDMNNVCKVNKNIECFMGNITLQQLSNGFINGSENVLDLLDKEPGIIKPFAKGNLDLLKYISIVASRDADEINNYDIYLKQQIGKDMMRDVIIINDYYIRDLLNNNLIFKEFYSLKLTNKNRTNILSLVILGELNDKLGDKLSEEDIYDKLMLLSTLLHQGPHGEALLIFEEYITKSMNIINKNNNNIEELYGLALMSPIINESNNEVIKIKTLNNDPKPNDELDKYIKLIINNNEISFYSVLRRKFMFSGNFDNPYLDGYFFSVLHIDVLNLTYEIKYFTMDINYPNYNYIPTKFENLKENISENKPAVTAGTLLTLGALSAIPIALLLGGRKSKKRPLKNNKNGKNKKGKKGKKSKKRNKQNKTKRNNKNNRKQNYFKTKHKR